jgi:hypothetical protein
MAYTRQQVREAVERAGDEHWQALIRHHEDAYPTSRPTPGDLCRAEAERLNQLGLGDAADLTLVETRVERTDSTMAGIRLSHGHRPRLDRGSRRSDPAVGGARAQDRATPRGVSAQQPVNEAVRDTDLGCECLGTTRSGIAPDTGRRR